jgi:putative ABC transport system permease protein
VALRDGLLSGGTARAVRVTAAALDAEGYQAVVAGTPAAGLLPTSLSARDWASSSGTTPESAIPAVLVGEAASRPALSVGDAFSLSAFGRATHYRVAGILSEFPGATAPQGTVIVPVAAVMAAEPERPLFPNQVFVRASPEQEEALREASVGRFGAPNVSIVSRGEVRALMDRDPLVRDTSIGFVLAMLVSLAFAALVVAVAVFRDVTSRANEIALLRALGTRPRQVMGVIVVEQGTVVLTAVAGGLALGCAMSLLAVPSLGLDRFVRPGMIVDAAIDWPVVSAVAVGQALLALVVMVLATLVARRRDPVPSMMREA